jgi:hypothetical protein
VSQAFHGLGIFVTLLTAIIAPILYAVTGKVLIPWVLAIACVLTLVSLYLVRRRTSAGEVSYFERIDFGEPNDSTILDAVDGILNTKKAQPHYVYAAPQCK